MKKNLGLFIIAIFTLAPHVWGQTASAKKPKIAAKGQKIALVNTSQYRINKPKRVAEENPFSGSLEISRSSSLYDLKNGNKYDGMDYLLAFNYKFNAGYVSTKLSYSQDLNDKTGENSTINDTNLTYSHASQEIYNDENSVAISWSPSATAIIPLSERSQKVEQLQSAIIGAVSLKILAGERSAMSGAGLSLSLTAGQNFHQYETDPDGNFLNKNSSNQSIAAFYTLSDFTFTVSYANKIRWPYQGDARYSFDLSEDITYSFLKSWSASIGHTNSGSTLKPNGYDTNVSLVDDDNSIVYLGLAYGF